MPEFPGKRYVVTGAASGIGHVVAEQLLAAGAEVAGRDVLLIDDILESAARA